MCIYIFFFFPAKPASQPYLSMSNDTLGARCLSSRSVLRRLQYHLTHRCGKLGVGEGVVGRGGRSPGNAHRQTTRLCQRKEGSTASSGSCGKEAKCAKARKLRSGGERCTI